jgi:hypothetical protein
MMDDEMKKERKINILLGDDWGKMTGGVERWEVKRREILNMLKYGI